MHRFAAVYTERTDDNDFDLLCVVDMENGFGPTLLQLVGRGTRLCFYDNLSDVVDVLVVQSTESTEVN